MSKVFKRVSAVAVLALGLNGLTGVAANAAAADITVGTAYASGGTGPTARTATQLAGVNNFVTYTVETAAVGTPLAIATTGGAASCVTTTGAGFGGAHTIVGNGSANVIVTTSTAPVAPAVAAVTCTTTTPTVGTVTVRVFGFTAGAQNATSTSSLTITVIDAASLALTTLTVYSVANGGCVAPLPTASTVTYMSKSAALGASELCVVAKDGNGANMATAVNVTVSTNLGYMDSDGDAAGLGTAQAVGSATIAAGTASAAFDIGGNGVSGTGTYSVSATSGGKTLTGSVAIRFFDDVAKITLTSSKSAFSLTPVAAATFASFKAEDKNGFPVALTLAAGEGSFAVSSDVGGATAGIGSDKSAMTWSATTNTVSNLGVETAGVLQVVTGAVNEMATVALINSGITSNAVTFYASGAAATASALKAENANPGTSQTISVTYSDSKGYPVADGSAVTFTATTGALSGVTTTANGVATASFAAPVVGGFDVDIASSLNSIAATKKIAIAGGNLQMAIDAASDAAAEAIDAANAATDAANLAAEAADAATVAAEEARDAADAATAAVEELAQQVATLMAALRAQITTLANTVAKIAKKVKA